MFVDLFIKRPVFAIVCALIILLVGLISITTLPVAQFPNISPMQIVVRANYVGASATVVEETVTNVLEREINGVEGMIRTCVLKYNFDKVQLIGQMVASWQESVEY